MFFLKEHLIGHHYNWDNGDILLKGDLSRRIFNRADGNHVLHMLNSFAKSVGTLTLTDGQKLEELMMKELPVELKSEIAVFNWLRGCYLYSND